MWRPENELGAHRIDTIMHQPCGILPYLPQRSVHLIVTSPPYNVGKEYDKDLSIPQWKEMMHAMLGGAIEVLVDGGRVCVNSTGIGRKPWLPLHHWVREIGEELGFWPTGEIIWFKGHASKISTGWGSWLKPTAPVLRDTHEYVTVLQKTPLRRQKSDVKQATISTEDFLRDTLSVWEIRPAHASRVGHPAPFPEELPSRLINLYTYEGDVVLDPFMGSGTTAMAAKRLRRHYVGYETVPAYIELAKRRIAEVEPNVYTNN